MALPDAPRGVRGAGAVGQGVVAADGVRGLYRGLGTVVCGVIPARGAYLTTLEAVKAAADAALQARAPTLSDASRAAVANLAGGATASLATQVLTVPVDVVSQRLMVQGGSGGVGGGAAAAATSTSATPKRAPPPPIKGGLAMARSIIAAEGVRGLYRGFGASVATFVPSSAAWWAAYGGYQRAIWHEMDRWRSSGAALAADAPHSSGSVLGVQTAAALAAGITSSTLTTPLDVVKTRLQVSGASAAGVRPSALAVARGLLADEGARGLFRGLGPRMASVSLWGTCMVNAYEALKRAAAR